MNHSPDLLYLNLIKKTLAFTLWPEPPIPIMVSINERAPLKYKNARLKKLFFSTISKILSRKKLQITETQYVSETQRTEGKMWPGYADTMIGLKRLDNLQHCVEAVLRENIEGDLIETGVWRGGACIFMRAILAAYKDEDRKIYVADSFEGLPKPDIEKNPADKEDRHHIYTYLAVSQKDVEDNFRKYSLLDEQVVFLKGWFKDTLPKAPIEKLSILRLDGDMYGSTMDALASLYPKLSKGGFCIIDDYFLSGCKSAVDDYRTKHAITSELKKIDWSGVYWEKEKYLE